ncbi:hydroxypyruvate isomerase family protein [Isoptericola sp. BMS4]|uniref:hydroxypyruvate isomerase family protein n=1 Tax=Isoptericola sp. BMS4 TaxID=2527875 RepID=UPI00141F09CA|nr:TIM barrel protein [Isoptericola sp. BMS4]
MRWSDYEVSANVSLLFTEVPYEHRFRAAADAGFTTVESWWPFAEPHPGDDRLDELAGLVDDAGVRLTGLNFFAGDMPAGERGVACRPERAGELDANAEALLRVARATGCRGFNLLFGQLDAGVDGTVQRAAAVGAYRRAADAVADVDGTVLVEPLAVGLNGSYPLTTHHDALRLAAEVGSERLALLLDTFHLASNGVDVAAVPDEAAGRVGHVQLADAPGRGEPGSGAVGWEAFAGALRGAGYAGTVAAEYKPTCDTTSSLAWGAPDGRVPS